ncbi:Phage prohead protease, HK97 family [Sphingobium yanoikuyae]|uniref:Phage prohead protease, HK97 family n=1 Tax=Sphingobium yanoikuyae TaxID=13690 RepID=A0A084E6F4_SPHYA|nr:HK97 family phage prohead protease [Sphingobium yanoikuyae]KEZ13546.1 Phage prohead protease, HK97 family [Sphingobium yanoikuyae]
MSNLARAYSFIEIKSADDDRRIIEGVATTPTPDRSQDIVRPMGAKFSLPLPFLWQHRHDEPIGHVIDADPKPSGIKFKAHIQKTDEPGKLKDRLDEAWLSLKLKLVRATSIGFRPLKYSFIENGGIDFEEWDWLELSGVTIPANPDAAITAVKQFDRIFREAQGIPDLEILPPEARAPSGKTRVVKLDDPARVRAKPFVINRILRP